MLIKKMKQKGGNNSNNVQVENIVVNNGISYNDAKDIALEVFHSNFIELSEEAASVARNRAEEITASFLKILLDEYPVGIKQAENPDFQFNLFEAQKFYAKVGDKRVAKLLVELLVKRTRNECRNTEQISIDEAISVVPKLTETQINLLSIFQLLYYPRESDFKSIQEFSDYLDKYFAIFELHNIFKSEDITHLQYASCIAMNENINPPAMLGRIE